MFSRKKPEKPKRDHSGNLAQFGLFDIPKDFNPMGQNDAESDGGDSDLEAELNALAGGSGARGAPKPKKVLKKPLSKHELDALVGDSLKDDPLEDEDVDEDDPDLLSELQEITGDDEQPSTGSSSSKDTSPQKSASSEVISTLTNRIKNYQIAEEDAKTAGETSKAKRYGRALKTLNDLLKKAKAGGDVDMSDDTIPPEIKIKPKQPPGESTNDGTPSEIPVMSPSRPAPAVPSQPLPSTVQENVTEAKKNIDEELVNMLLGRQKEYKIAALQAKKSGNTENALQYVKVAKAFDHVIEAVKRGEAVDLSDMPPPPGELDLGSMVQRNETQKQAAEEPPADLPEPQLKAAETVEEALQQRLDVYKSYEQKAKEEDDNSKARRFGRIVKQYEQAIKAYKAGRPVPVDELPTPPGFAPIPVPGAEIPAPADSAPKPAPRAKPSADQNENVQGNDGPKPNSTRISGNKTSTSHQEKQIAILLAKQKQFKVAALEAKKQGELVQAKEFLRQAKGFDRLIEAAQGGLPVDWASIPVSPEAKSQLDNEYDIVMGEECTERDDEDIDVLSRLEIQLTKQLKMCLSTRDHHKALGDVAGTNRFERLALSVTKDLDIIRIAKRKGCGVPKFHYETKDFSIVKSFTDISNNELDLCIVRGINYKTDNPKDIDTYVKFEFPFPQETPVSNKTGTIKDTNCPEYNHSFVLPIQRDSRQCQRVFKRHGIKFEVYSKGGFFRSDALIGTVNLKLQPLETHCEIHDSFDLMDGRKNTGGKLEVRLRLRTPIVTQQVEKIEEKWLIIDQ